MTHSQSSAVELPRMRCMEVRGGKSPTEPGLCVPGMDVWLGTQNSAQSGAGGGELHYVSSCASGRITRLLLSDICAIAPVFSALAAELRDLMMRNINTVRQARLVRQVNERLRSFSQCGGYASVIISTHFAPTRSFTFCNAGHPWPLLYRAHEQSWSAMKANLADVPPVQDTNPDVLDPCEYQHFTTELAVGDMVLIYSDALTECRDAQGQLVGTSGVRDRAARIDAANPSEIVPALLRGVREEHRGNLADHDATVMLCRATRTAVRWQDNLLAPLRFFRRAIDSTCLK